MRRFVWGLALAVALVLPGTAALADDTSIGSWGGTARPMQSTNIRMAAETVQCICYRQFAEYRVDFRFENSGASTSVPLGFPFYTGGDDNIPPAAFHAWRDGVPLAVTVQHGTDNGEPMDFYVHTVDFRSGATTVTVDYLVSPTSSNLGGSYAIAAAGTPYAAFGGNLNDYNYTLHTGANWAGTIGTAVLRWTLSPDFLGWGIPKARKLEAKMYETDAEPEYLRVFRQRDLLESHPMQPDSRTYQYVLRDFEPTETADGASAYDIGLHYFEPWESDDQDNPNKFAGPDAKASSWLQLEDYEYPPDDLVDGDPSSAWAEDAKGPGIGEHIDFEFLAPQDIRELRILPGYAKRPDLFAKYNRPKRLRVDYSNGTSQIVQLADDPSLQRFPANATAKSARITILDVYRGTTRNETYMSEVEFGTAPAPKFLPFATLLAASTKSPSNTAATSTSPTAAASTKNLTPPAPTLVLVGVALSIAAFVAALLLLQRKSPDASGSPVEPDGEAAGVVPADSSDAG